MTQKEYLSDVVEVVKRKPKMVLETQVSGQKPYFKPRINNVIYYKASQKLLERSGAPESHLSNTVWVDQFNTPLVSHTFENGVGTLIFEDDVTEIKFGAFIYSQILTDIKLPPTLEKIDNMTFYAANLKSIKISSNVKFIGAFAFSLCSNLKKLIILGNNIESIGPDIFSNSNAIKEVYIQSGIIQQGTFSNCNISKLVLGNDVVSIGSGAFYKSELDYLYIPASVQTIEENAFKEIKNLEIENIKPDYDNRFIINYNNLTNLIINSGEINDRQFCLYTGLTNIILRENVTSIGNRSFNRCIKLKSIVIPNSVTTLGDYAFEYCTALESAIIGTGVTEIKDYTFYANLALTDVQILGKIIKIGTEAFTNCNKLEQIEIPDSIQSIEDRAFENCSKLSKIVIKASTPPTLVENAFRFTSSDMKIYVPAESVDLYKETEVWNLYADYIEPIVEE